MTCALRYARAAPALAMSYISVVLTIIYGYFIFHEVRAWPTFSLYMLRQICGTDFPTNMPLICSTGQHVLSGDFCNWTFHMAPKGLWKHPVRQSMR